MKKNPDSALNSYEHIIFHIFWICSRNLSLKYHKQYQNKQTDLEENRIFIINLTLTKLFSSETTGPNLAKLGHTYHRASSLKLCPMILPINQDGQHAVFGSYNKCISKNVHQVKIFLPWYFLTNQTNRCWVAAFALVILKTFCKIINIQIVQIITVFPILMCPFFISTFAQIYRDIAGIF